MVRRSFLLAFALIGCESASPEEDAFPPPVTDASAPRTPIGPEELVVENDTNARVTVVVRAIDTALALDRRVLDGSFALPMGPASALTEDPVAIDAGAQSSLDLGIVHVVDHSAGSVRNMFGTFLGLEGGPAFLALGSGRVHVRTVGGAPALEPEDPRVVTILPVARDVATCPAGVTGTPIEGLPTGPTVATQRPIASVSSDAAGCRLFESDIVPLVRVCLPAEAYPFDAADALTIDSAIHVIGGVRHGVRIENDKGAAIDLLYASVPPRQSTSIIDDLGVTLDADPTCAVISATCGDVEVPASTTVAFGGASVSNAKIGAPIAHPTQPQTAYVLAARARPIGLESCSARPAKEFFSAADLSLVIVTRP